jgi:hypothetical protein
MTSQTNSARNLTPRPIFASLRRCCALAALLLAAQSAWAGSVPERIRSLSSEYGNASRTAASPYDERVWLGRFYGARDYAPAWTGGAAAQAHTL